MYVKHTLIHTYIYFDYTHSEIIFYTNKYKYCETKSSLNCKYPTGSPTCELLALNF